MIFSDEATQSDWDRKCAAAPKCVCCGRSVYCWDTYHTVAGEFIFCEKCFDHEEDLTANLEMK